MSEDLWLALLVGGLVCLGIAAIVLVCVSWEDEDE